jgi:hypothetical protein
MLIETQIPQTPPIADYGSLTGLNGDDHTQYLLVDGQRSIVELYIGSSYSVYLYDNGGDAHLYADGDIYLEPVDKVHINGDLDVYGTEIHLSLGALRLRSNDSNYDTEYDNFDSSNHIFQYQGSDLFAVKSTGIYIYSASDEANIKMNGNDLEIWGGYGDIVLFPYDYTVVHYLLAPDGIEFDIYGSENISSSSGDMFYYAYYGHTFYGDNALRSMGGFMSGDGNAGITTTITYSDGLMAFEDGLLVFETVF